MKVKSESEVAQSCPTPSDPMDCSRQGSSIHGIFQARVLEWDAIALSEMGLRWHIMGTWAHSDHHTEGIPVPETFWQNVYMIIKIYN